MTKREHDIFISRGALVAFIALLGACIYLFIAIQGAIDEIHDSQIRACEKSLQPGGIRYIVAERINRDLAASQNLDLDRIAAQFGISVEQLRESQAYQRKEARDLMRVNCNNQYPKP